MTELKLQKEFLVPFFTKTLNYIEVSANTVNSSLIIKNDLLRFLKNSKVNKDSFKRLLKKFKNSEKDLIDSLIVELSKRIKEHRNIAIFFKANHSITFEDEKIYLFGKSGSELKGDEAFEENIFSVVQEFTYQYKFNDKVIFEFRPDITLFLNGIYLGYSELKSRDNRQTAQDNGIKKVREDYKRAIISYLENIHTHKILTDDEKKEYKKDLLKIFHKAISITTTDLKETYIIRDIEKLYDEVKKLWDDEKADYSRYDEKLEESFKAYPLTTKSNDIRIKLEEVFTAHYSKKMIEKEILYYNFIEKEVKTQKGKKLLKNEYGTLISPRPKQKFGVDKIMSKIAEFISHEDEPDYFINKLKDELKGLPQKQRDEFISQRMAYKNNQNVYSLLLQYAAGFGKSNIIGWSALQLKDLRDKDGQYIYDKIMIVVDRVQLRDQLDTKLFNMNIDNSMYIEASSKKTFQDALRNRVRIVIVNIQKFNFLEIQDSEILKDLAKSRTVFLIDEIHRSNNGDQNEKMLNTFDDLQLAFDSEDYIKEQHKKNLIIGFTATPSDITLSRFGEFVKFAENQKYWRPFDSYTMDQAIKDGFIFNPLDNIKPVSAQMRYSMTDRQKAIEKDKNNTTHFSINKKDIYENIERIDDIAKYIIGDLINDTYTQIKKTAKAMLATSSIKSAKIYKEKLDKYYSEIKWTTRTQSFKEAPIYIVYSVSQDEGTATSLNNGLTEKEVLQQFSLQKNGIIIVVDKLQTGFDEPKLHTLYLDKEIKDINAIQTISRVNRKAKNKVSCKIVDFSHLNVNINNLKVAFERFSDVVASDFDPIKELKNMQKLYKELISTVIYKLYFSSYKSKICDNEDISIDTELDIKTSFTNYLKMNEELSEEIKNKIQSYFQSLYMIDKVMSFDSKYSEECFLNFMILFYTGYVDEFGKKKIKEFITVEYVKNIGLVNKEPDDNGGSKGGDGKGNGTEKPPIDILSIIEKRNKEEEEIGKLIEEFKIKVIEFYTYIKADKKFNELKGKINNTHFSQDEIYNDFIKIYKRIVLTKRDELGEFFIKESKDLGNRLCDDFIKLLIKTK